ncbi:MAG: GNAT family N-acetyltransferase [bacterium]
MMINNTRIQVQKAQIKHCDVLSNLHKKNIHQGFLSRLGKRFLSHLYELLVTSKSAFCLVIEDKGKIIGFISGADSLNTIYKEFLKKKSLVAIISILSLLTDVRLIQKAFETLCYPIKNENLPSAELLSMVVVKGYRGTGVSKILFERLIEEFRMRNIKQFKIVAGAALTSACKFYEKMGAIFHSEIEVHKGEKSNIYILETSEV